MADPQPPAQPPANAAPTPSLGVQRQLEIYLAGLKGHRPSQPIAPEALEAEAQAVLPPQAYVYVAGGAGCEDTVRLIGRAEGAGFQAVVVTLDTYLLGWRERDLQMGWLPFAHAQGIANYLSDPAFRAALPAPPEKDPAAAVRHFLANAAHRERHLLSGVLEPVRVAVLADALEEAGVCVEVLNHLRGADPHYCGCWAIDLCLSRS